MRFHALREGLPAEADDMQGRVLDRGLPGATWNCDPYFGGKLRAEAVEAQRGKQTDHSFWNGRSGEHQPVMLCYGLIRQPVHPPLGPSQFTGRRFCEIRVSRFRVAGMPACSYASRDPR